MESSFELMVNSGRKGISGDLLSVSNRRGVSSADA